MPVYLMHSKPSINLPLCDSCKKHQDPIGCIQNKKVVDELTYICTDCIIKLGKLIYEDGEKKTKD